MVHNVEGDDNIAIGDVKGNTKGNRNIRIGPTDDKGNVNLKPMIVGTGAQGGSRDVVIGTNAKGSSDLIQSLQELKEIMATSDNPDSIKLVVDLIKELQSSEKDKNKIKSLWDRIKSFNYIGATDLIIRIVPLIAQFLH